MGRLDEEKSSNSSRTGGIISRIGILGSGQLAQMLSEAAVALKLTPVLYSEGLENELEVESFIKSVDVVVFESDFLPFSSLVNLKEKKFCPELSVIQLISDKLGQKKILEDLKIPTAPFLALGRNQKIDEWIESCYRRFHRGCVFKWSRGGYDGKGVHISDGKSTEDREFIVDGYQKNSDVFAEERIDFVHEISLVSVFSTKGEWAFYPLVVSEQENGICRNVFGPAKNFRVSSHLESSIQEASKKLGETLKLYGTFALEAFETKEGGFVVNEIAPRVHNTGHFSIDFCEASQFENHLRAVTGQKLGSTATAQNFFMRNILGDRLLLIDKAPDLKFPSSWHFKWYNKSEVRKGRKMGHLNFGGFAPDQLDEVRAAALKYEQQILNSLK